MHSVPRRCEQCEKQLWPSEIGVCGRCQNRAAATGATQVPSTRAGAWSGGFFAGFANGYASGFDSRRAT